MYGVPNIKLPKNIVMQKIEALQDAGVEFRLQTDIGKQVTLPICKRNLLRLLFVLAVLHRDV